MNKQRGAKIGDYETIHHIQLEPTNDNKSIIDTLISRSKTKNVLEGETKLQIIHKHFTYILELCKKYPNDMELGSKIRKYLKNIIK